MADTTLLAICAGIGGLEMGARRAFGCRPVGYVEWDAYAASVLLARMEAADLEPAPIWCGDVANLPASAFLHVDVVAAGFPCQPFSAAGKQRGIEDERWIWPAIASVLGRVRPGWVILENVPGLVRHGLGHVLGDLATLGFDAAWGLFRAADVGAPHRRARWFLLGKRRVPDAERHALRLQPERGAGPARSAESRNAVSRDVGARSLAELREPSGRERLTDGANPTLADAPGGHGRRRIRGTEAGVGEGGERRWGSTSIGRAGGWPFPWPPGPNDAERWAVVPAQAQPAVRGVADGIPARVDRLRCLGNAVVPAQAELALRTLAERLP